MFTRSWKPYTLSVATEPLERRQLLSASFVTQHNLASDGAVPADNLDPRLKNPWGLAADDEGPAWIANNGDHTATLHTFEDGTKKSLVVHIAGADNGNGEPTGEIYNQAEHTFIVRNITVGELLKSFGL